VSIPPDAQGISVSPDGQVFANEDGNTTTQIGTIRLTTFANATGLKAMGGNYYSPTPSSGNANASQPGVQGTGTVKQGYLERSNVETVDELVALIVAQRNYEVNSRAIRVSDEMLQQVNQLVR
jgi:flagellar basal-body rod protein FlgG